MVGVVNSIVYYEQSLEAVPIKYYTTVMAGERVCYILIWVLIWLMGRAMLS